MTPEEKTVIALALRWARGWATDEQLQRAIQELKISRQPLQGPELIPCMARARHSATMFCVLPKGHVGIPNRSRDSWRWAGMHQGYAAGMPPRGGGVRVFYAREEDQAVSTGQQ
jgi:hypothetical protein